jgi:predicted metalloprotease
VIAHEIGHHVQTLLGTSDKMDRSAKSQTEANKLSVALELQADFMQECGRITTSK